MNRVVLGVIALLVLVGAIVYASRGVINRNLTQVVPQVKFKPMASVSPWPTGLTLPVGSPGGTVSPGSKIAGVNTYSPIPVPSVTPRPVSSGILPATGL